MSCIGKRRSVRRGKQAPKKEKEEDDCPICLYELSDPDAPCSTWSSFPCSHKVCSICFTRCEACPICRTGKDGRSGEEIRKERAAREQRSAAFRAIVDNVPGRIIEYRSYGNSHPFAPGVVRVTTHALPPGLASIFPQLMDEAIEGHAPRRGIVRRTTHGERQQAAAFHAILDILGHELPSSAERMRQSQP